MGTASSIAASMNRRGGWSQFSVHHLLGVGVRSDAAARSLRAFVGIDEIIGDLEVQFAHLPDVTQALAGLRDEMKEWEQEFLAQALALGRAAFKPQLDEANELWRACVERWGQGAGYRDNIASILDDWFRTNENLDSARRSVESGLNQIWKELVLDALIGSASIRNRACSSGAAHLDPSGLQSIGALSCRSDRDLALAWRGQDAEEATSAGHRGHHRGDATRAVAGAGGPATCPCRGRDRPALFKAYLRVMHAGGGPVSARPGRGPTQARH